MWDTVNLHQGQAEACNPYSCIYSSLNRSHDDSHCGLHAISLLSVVSGAKNHIMLHCKKEAKIRK